MPSITTFLNVLEICLLLFVYFCLFTFVCLLLFVYFYHCCFAGHWHVVGLVSWGLGCGEDDLPAVYVNVFHYLDFIYSSFADQTWVNIGDFARSQTIG
jgi:hypothetical protein